MANKRPNPNEAFPNPNLPRLCYIKNVVKNPRIIIGDYTYYDDVDGADQFEKHVTHFYDFIGEWCQPQDGLCYDLSILYHGW